MQPGADHLAVMRLHLRCRAVDCVALTDRIDMWIDDEGQYTKLVNPGRDRAGSPLRLHLAGLPRAMLREPNDRY